MTVLTKEAIAARLVERHGVTYSTAKALVEAFLEIIKSKLEGRHDVKINGFGKWTVNRKKARPGRNPHTGEAITIEPRKVVTFSPSDRLRNAVNVAPLSKDEMALKKKAADRDAEPA